MMLQIIVREELFKEWDYLYVWLDTQEFISEVEFLPRRVLLLFCFCSWKAELPCPFDFLSPEPV